MRNLKLSAISQILWKNSSAATLPQRSSSQWHTTQSNDVFVKAAKAENYRCRSAFKLLQINESFKIFKGKKRVVDLGAAPGSWSQVAVKLVPANSSTVPVLSVDILDFEPVPGTFHLPRTNIEDKVSIDKAIEKIWGEEKPQLVLSDMLHNVSGEKSYDHLNSIKLCSHVLKFCFSHLENNGSVVMKIYNGPHETKFVKLLEVYFKKVKRFKPDASRKTSKEHYLIALRFERRKFDKKYNKSEEKDDLSAELD